MEEPAHESGSKFNGTFLDPRFGETATGSICTFSHAVVTASWLVLLARYGMSDSITVRQEGSLDNSISALRSSGHADRETTEIHTPADEKLFSIKQHAEGLWGQAIISQSSISAFPPAENCGLISTSDDSFLTAIIRSPQATSEAGDSQEYILDHVSRDKYAIVVTLVVDSVVLVVDKRISSPEHDPGLPARLLAQLALVCEQLSKAAPGGATVADLEFMTEIDKKETVSNETPLPQGVEDVMHNLFFQVAQRYPDADAICSWDGKMTYLQLDETSSALAAQLRKLGVRRGVTVPLFFEKSKWHPVAMLAVSKAGGTWVTIPFDMPRGRVDSIVEQCGCLVGVCSPDMEVMASELVPSLLRLDNALAVQVLVEAKLHEQQETLYSVEADDLAYIIFTSGTTGNPKGIKITHKNICTFVSATIKSLGVCQGPGMRRGQMLSYAFDMSLLESLTALCNGGCLCILSEHERLNDISGAMTRRRVTDMDMTPSLADSLDPEDFPTVERIHLAGEALTKSIVDKWQPHVEVFTSYGPAECTIISHLVSTRDALWGSCCIGRPVQSKATITDPQDPHRRLPRGFVGEILIEGPIVSRGYVKNVQKTAEAFVEGLRWASLNSDGQSRRFYRSGDVGYVDSNGLYWIKGRRDLQVKIRGQRLELTEVESNLQTHIFQSERAVADVITLRNGTKVLVAFLKLEMTKRLPTATVFIQTLRSRISERLPPAFVPSAFLLVDQIPMGPTGKTDRKALKALVGDTSMAELLSIQHVNQKIRQNLNGKASPMAASEDGDKSKAQRNLAMIWAKVLGVNTQEVLDQDANFLNLGGDSLKAQKLVSFAKKKGMNLTVSSILRNPTLSAMATAVLSGNATILPVKDPNASSEQEDASWKQHIATDLGVDVRFIEDVYQATRIQESLWTLSLTDKGAYVLQYTFKIPSEADICRLRDSWLRVIDRNPILRTRFYQASNALWQVVLAYEPRFWQELQELDSSKLRSRLRQQLTSAEGNHEQGLSNLTLLQTSNGQDKVLVWTISHALTDGWSSELVIQSVKQAYHGYILPVYPPFKSFSVVPTAKQVASEKSYWMEQLQDTNHASIFPAPFPPDIRPRTDSKLETVLQLESGPKMRSHRLPLVLRAAWALTMSAVANSSDVVFGVALNGRSNTCSDGIIGPMVVTVPVRVGLNASHTLEKFLGNLHEQSVAMMEFEHTGLHTISDSGPEYRRACGFQSLLVVQTPMEISNDVNGNNISQDNSDWLNGSEGEQTASHALVIDCQTHSESVDIRVSFDSRIINKDSVRHVAGLFSSFIELVQQELQNPDITVGSLSDAAIKRDNFKGSVPHPSPIWSAHTSGATVLPVRFQGKDVFLDEIETEIQTCLPGDLTCLVDVCRPADVAFEMLTCIVSGFKASGKETAGFTEVVNNIVSRVAPLFGSHFMMPAGFYPVVHLAKPEPVLPEHGEKAFLRREMQRLVGKLNLSELLQTNDTKQSAPETSNPPTLTEETLVQLWRQVLPKDAGVDNSGHFVVLGGDSIRAIRLVAVAKRAGFSITVAEILRYPLLRDMARYLKSSTSKISQASLDGQLSSNGKQLERTAGKESLESIVAHQLKLTEKDIDSVLPTTPFQKHTMNLCLKSPGMSVFQQRYTMSADMDVDRLAKAWELVCEAFSNLRSRLVFSPDKDDLMHVILRTHYNRLEISHFQTEEEAQDLLLRLRLEASSLCSPLAHAVVLYVENNPPLFIWAVNHVVYDGFTLDLIWHALHEAYWLGKMTTRLLPADPLLAYISQRDHAAAIQFWAEYFAGAADTPFPVMLSEDISGRNHENRITSVSNYNAPIKVSSSRLPFTMATIIRAAWGLTIGSYTNTPDVSFLGILSGRNAPVDGIETMMGPTLNYVPIRVPIETFRTSTSTEYLAHIHRSVIDAMPYEGFGIDAIAEINDDTARMWQGLNNCLIIHGSAPQDPQPPLPLTPAGSVIDFVGSMALYVNCTPVESDIAIMVLFDQAVLNQQQVDGIAQRLEFFMQSLVADVQGSEQLPVGRLFSKFNEVQYIA